MKQLKIGFDAKRLFCNNSGLGNYSRSLVAALHEFYPQHQYYLYSPQIPNNNYSKQFRISNYNLRKASFRPAWMWRRFGVSPRIKKDKLDIYHGLSHELPAFISKTSAQSILTVHDVIPRVLPDSFPLFDRLSYHVKLKSSCKNAHHIVVISQNTKQDLISYYGVETSKISVIYQACQTVFYEHLKQHTLDNIVSEYRLPSEYLLYVGALSQRKNVENLLNAYSSIAEQLDIPLVIVGKGNLYETLRKKSVELKINNRIIWLDKISSNVELKGIYQMAKALIYPSFYEGFGLPIAEAMLSRTAVIASNAASMREAGGNDSWYFNPYSPDSIAQAILDCLQDSEQHKDRIERAYQYAVQQYSRKGMADKYMELYNNC